MFKCFVFILMFLSFSFDAKADSAVSYGLRTVHSNEAMKNTLKAVQKSLEACSKVDRSCQLLIACDKEGFGAVAVERENNVISSVGAACGLETAEKAKEQALKRCSENKAEKECNIISQWKDE